MLRYKKNTTRTEKKSDRSIEEMQENVRLWDVPLVFDPTETIPMNCNVAQIDEITLRQSPEREPMEEVTFILNQFL